MSRMPVARFAYECAEACGQGTDDPDEFGKHLGACRFIQPGVRQKVQAMLDAGRPIMLTTKQASVPSPEQPELPQMPKMAGRVKRRR